MKNSNRKLNFGARVAVLISGNGSNLQALIDAAKDPSFPAEITLVISNKEDAYGLQRAAAAGIPSKIIDHRQYQTREEFEQIIVKSLEEYKIDIICLAGFMRILSPYFINHYPNKILNIHPSLLPKFKGMNAIKQALDAGETETGCSVHFVTQEMDEGELVLQKSIPIMPGESLESITARVHEVEHITYPDALAKFAASYRNAKS